MTDQAYADLQAYISKKGGDGFTPVIKDPILLLEILKRLLLEIKAASAASSVGSGTWGGITGTLSDQTDLASALAAKATPANITTAINALLGSAGAAYDTLKELQDLIMTDETAISGLLTAVGLRLLISDISNILTGTSIVKALSEAQGKVLKDLIDGNTTNITTNTSAIALKSPKLVGVAVSDEVTALSIGTGKVTFRMPYAMTLSAVRASLVTAQTSGSIFTVDVNEGGTTILSTKLTIDNTEKTSTTALTAPVISDTALADDAEITVDIDQIGDGTAKGLKIWLIGT